MYSPCKEVKEAGGARGGVKRAELVIIDFHAAKKEKDRFITV